MTTSRNRVSYIGYSTSSLDNILPLPLSGPRFKDPTPTGLTESHFFFLVPGTVGPIALTIPEHSNPPANPTPGNANTTTPLGTADAPLRPNRVQRLAAYSPEVPLESSDRPLHSTVFSPMTGTWTACWGRRGASCVDCLRADWSKGFRPVLSGPDVDACPPWRQSLLFIILVPFAGASGGQQSGAVAMAVEGVITCSALGLRLIRVVGRAVMPCYSFQATTRNAVDRDPNLQGAEV